MGALAVLLLGAALLTRLQEFAAGQLWGAGAAIWFWIAVALAVAHQVYVWICWRMELHGAWLSRWLGPRAFTIYAAGFAVLGVSRAVAVFLVAIANRNTLPFDPTVLRVLAVIVLLPALYLFFSVHRYFGFRRAFGADHFDSRYRTMPFVREGIFRYTSNGMYVFGFLLLWSAGLWFASVAGLAAALFNHLYVWVHYFATERPDMRRIYGSVHTDG